VIEKTDLSFGADSRNRLAEADPSADGDPDALRGYQPAIRGGHPLARPARPPAGRASLAQNAAARGCRGDTSCGL